MNIIVPTRGRIGSQHTVRHLTKRLRQSTTIVCPEREVRFHSSNHPDVTVVAQPDPDMTIAQKRKWIIETCKTEKMIMLDDDLDFLARCDENPLSFRKSTDEDKEKWFDYLDNLLCADVPHGGFHAKTQAHLTPRISKSPGRMMYVLGYHVPSVLRECELGRIEHREDMDVTLQLLLKGYPNTILTELTANQKFGNKGGCSGQRTLEASDADAHRLAELHKGYVKVVRREYEHSPARFEVVVQWQRALRDGQLRRAAAAARGENQR